MGKYLLPVLEIERVNGLPEWEYAAFRRSAFSHEPLIINAEETAMSFWRPLF